MCQFECEKAPSKSRIQNWVDHFKKYGTLENLNYASKNRPRHSGHPKKQTAELVKSVRESLVRVQNALCVSEVSPLVFPVILAGERW